MAACIPVTDKVRVQIPHSRQNITIINYRTMRYSNSGSSLGFQPGGVGLIPTWSTKYADIVQ